MDFLAKGLVALVLSGLAACGGDDDGIVDVDGGGGGIDSGMPGDGGGIDAPGHDGGSDAGPPPPCPDALPGEGDPCPRVGQVCYYELCPTGVYRVECGGVGWEPTEQPCEAYPCNPVGGTGETCMGDELCVSRQTGAFIVECVADPCGDGPIEPECACTICGDLECTLDGFSVSCTSDCTKCP